jgi:hypothetical protein
MLAPGARPVDSPQLLTNSPWAKTLKSEEPGLAAIGSTGGFGGNPAADRSNPTRRATPHPSRPPKPDTKNALAFYGEVTIRWESALPIRRASETPLPPEFQGHYAISVTGLPPRMLLPDAKGRLPNATLMSARLRPQNAELVALTADKRTLLFAFPRFEPTRKTIVFTVVLNGLTVTTKFEPKKMLYEGHLTL